MTKIKKIRDLTLVSLADNQELVIACDSCGGVGLKRGDILQIAPVMTGKYTARVVMLEVMCTGADIIALTNAVCNEMEPTGRAIVDGVREELAIAGVDSVVLTGSTEENFPTVSTAVGMTAMGIVDRAALKVNTSRAGAWVIAIGEPKVGQEVLDSRPGEIPGYETIRYLLAQQDVYEIVPVGSKGILYEARQLAENNRLALKVCDTIAVDITKSAGPSTVLIAAVAETFLAKLQIVGQAVIVGRLAQE